MSVDEQEPEYMDHEPDAVPEPSVDQAPTGVLPVVSPPTGALSAERLAIKALETRLLGGERKLRRREVTQLEAGRRQAGGWGPRLGGVQHYFIRRRRRNHCHQFR